MDERRFVVDHDVLGSEEERWHASFDTFEEARRAADDRWSPSPQAMTRQAIFDTVTGLEAVRRADGTWPSITGSRRMSL